MEYDYEIPGRSYNYINNMYNYLYIYILYIYIFNIYGLFCVSGKLPVKTHNSWVPFGACDPQDAGVTHVFGGHGGAAWRGRCWNWSV